MDDEDGGDGEDVEVDNVDWEMTHDLSAQLLKPRGKSKDLSSVE